MRVTVYGHGFYLGGDENILELQGRSGCTTLNALNATELYSVKW